jgi:adrenodoxin-NADP+ reductase
MVHWYTSHPSQAHLPPPVDLSKVSHVTLIGQGNVSLDVARMLLMPASVLSSYDVPAPVLDELSRSQVKHVSIVGRRGPMQVAFTTKELREMINLPDSSMVPLDPGLCVAAPGFTATRQQSRTLQLLEKGSKNKFGSTDKTWSLDFFRSPKSLDVMPSGKLNLGLQHNTVDPETLRAVPTPRTSSLETDLVISALGFHAESFDPTILGASSPSSSEITKPSTVLKALKSRVLSPQNPSRVLKNVYASGWAANGARGVLASTMMDAYAVADVILSDWLPKSQPTTPAPAPSSSTEQLPDVDAVQGVVEITNVNADPESLPDVIKQGLKNGEVVEYPQWKRIDAEEVARGQKANGKERERMSWEEARRFVL